MKNSDPKNKDQAPDQQQQSKNQNAIPGQAPAGQPVPDKMGTFYALKFPGFRLLWFGSLFSTFSQWIQQATLSWVVYDMTGSGTLLGTVNGFRLVPNLIISPISGLAADLFDKKKILIYAQLPLLIMTLGMGVLFAFGKVETWHLLTFALLSGIPSAIFQPVRSSVIPVVVPRSALPNAAAMNSGAVTFTRILGPGAAGIMIAALGPSGNFFIQAAAYAMVMASIFIMVLPKAPKKATTLASVKKDFADGFAYCIKNKAVRILMVMALFGPFFIQPFQSLVAIFAKETFHSGPQGFGYLLAASGGGAVLGALVVGSANKVEKRGYIQLFGIIGFGVSIIFFALVTHFWLGLIMMMFTGAFQLFFLTTNQALVQLSVPPKLMGRVSGILSIEAGLLPVGSILSGFSSDVIGEKDTVIIMGAMCIGLGLLLLFFVPMVKNMGPSVAMRAQKELEEKETPSMAQSKV
ncbi:MAG: MFS transporter [Dehalococcoidia bacterium]|nr:MFS transporter [Dehalococcoidia bacterium]